LQPLLRSHRGPFFPHTRTTGLHLGSLPSTACFSNRTRHLPDPSFRLAQAILSQKFSRTNTPTISPWLFLLHTPPMKMEQSVPKRRHIKFRDREITEKKEYNIHNTAKVWNQEKDIISVSHIKRLVFAKRLQYALSDRELNPKCYLYWSTPAS